MRLYNLLICIAYIFCYSKQLHSRSVLRPANPNMPQLIAKWADADLPVYSITDSHIEEHPLFTTFNEAHFNRNRLPRANIPYRYNLKKSVSGTRLDKLIEQLIFEIKNGKKKYTDFILIQDKDFNLKKAAGLAVFKFKNYPFVLKLFIETPESFVNPWMKGTEPIWFFYMGGGVNRHITGLTRIRNRNLIIDRLHQIPKWRDFVDTPRKWFWTPKNLKWVELIGKNIGDKKSVTTKIPSTYAIIADCIEATEEITIFDRHKRKIALEICNTLDLYIDPHIDNYMVERGTNKLVIIDTEHFPTLVGFKEKRSFKTYVRWYLGLAGKAAHAMYFRNKKERLLAQKTPSQLSIF